MFDIILLIRYLKVVYLLRFGYLWTVSQVLMGKFQKLNIIAESESIKEIRSLCENYILIYSC